MNSQLPIRTDDDNRDGEPVPEDATHPVEPICDKENDDCAPIAADEKNEVERILDDGDNESDPTHDDDIEEDEQTPGDEGDEGERMYDDDTMHDDDSDGGKTTCDDDDRERNGHGRNTPASRLKRDICAPVGVAVNGIATWLIAGPVLHHEDVDPTRFSFAVRVQAAEELTGREVFARAVPKLIIRGHLPTRKSSHEALRLLACSSSSGQKQQSWEPSWDITPPLTEDMLDQDCVRVLRRAAEAVARARRRVAEGSVMMLASEDVRAHPAVKYANRLRERRREKHAVRAFRRSAAFTAMTPERQRGLVGSANGAALGRVRAWAELKDRVRPSTSSMQPGDSSVGRHQAGEPESEDGYPPASVRRATRRRLSSGMTAPKVLPSERVWARVRRQAVDNPNLPKHAMITLGDDGSVRVWFYVMGTATAGVREYRMEDGTRKRLAAPHLRCLRVADEAVGGAVGRAVSGSPLAADPSSTPGGASSSLHAATATRVAQEVLAEDLLPGGQRQARGEGTLSAMAVTAPPSSRSTLAAEAIEMPGIRPADSATTAEPTLLTAAVTADDRAAAHDANAGELLTAGIDQDEDENLMKTLADIAQGAGELRRGAPDTTERVMTKSTYLECNDGTGRELVVAVEIDAEESLRHSFRLGAEAAAEDATNGSLEATLAGDGGPVRRTTLTVFTLTASSTLFRTGRTPLMPILFLLSGEQAIHSAVGNRLQKQVRKALLATYSVPVVRNGVVLAGTTAKVQFPFRLLLCGDFSMLSHFLSLTGGSDAQRCPSWWLCIIRKYLSASFWLSHPMELPPGEVRNPTSLSRHWELVVWMLAIWCALTAGRVVRRRWVASGGQLTSGCPACDTVFVARSTSPPVQSCQNPSCTMYEAEGAVLLPDIAYTPLSTMFRRLRRMLGGTRGYPLLGDIPFVVQPPVLHCTGKIGKTLVWFQHALLSNADQETARSRIFAVLGRSNMGGMYLREFARLIALMVADEGVLDVRLDGGVLVLLQLSQLLTASWRRAIGTASPHERECAAATLQLVSGVLGFLYAALKPCDPGTKQSGVYNLYLHTALAHVRPTVGEAFPTANNICDDNIEGIIAELNRYFKTRTNNVSRGESLVNKLALDNMTWSPSPGRGVAEQKIFTEHIVMCPCVYDLSETARQDAAALAALARNDPNLAVKGRVNEASDATAPSPVLFTIPPAIVDAPFENADTTYERSSEELLQRSLRAAQYRLAVCCCGKLTNRPVSPVSLTAMQAGGAGSSPAHACAPSGDLTPRDPPGCGSRRCPQFPVPAEAPAPDEPLEPVEGERVYDFLHDMSDSDEEGTDDDTGDEDGADDGTVGADVDAGPHPPAPDARGRFLVQCAEKDPRIAAFVPARSVVDKVLRRLSEDDDADLSLSDADSMRMQEYVMMVSMLLARLDTPTFKAWIRKDGVQVNDVRVAAMRLKRTMVRMIARGMQTAATA